MSTSSRLSLADLCQPTSSSVSTSSSTSSMANISTSTTVHAGTKRPLTIDDQDEDVRMAVRALGDMRTRAVAHSRVPSTEGFAVPSNTRSRASSTSQNTPFLTNASTSTSTTNSSPVLPRQVFEPAEETNETGKVVDASSVDFVSRVSTIPLVGSALKAYDYSKKRSKVVKYGANLMESSVKTISRPVINRLPVEQIDEFACRQLDRFGYTGRADNVPTSSKEPMQTEEFLKAFQTYREPPIPESLASSRAPSVAPDSADEHSVYGSPSMPSYDIPPLQMPDLRDNPPGDEPNDCDSQDRQVGNRSRWQAVLSEAGGISAAVSVESMKRLKYCLHWLQYATARIDAQIGLLRTFIDSLNPQSSNDPNALVPLQAMRTLFDVRRDVIKTIKEVVDVISKYAGGALPEPARSTVRAFILRLPARANASRNPHLPSTPSSPNTGATHLPEPSDATLSTLPPSARPTAGRATHPTKTAATQAAQRILSLATESLDMMRSVTAVFKDSLEKAEAWVERLRLVGIQRHGAYNGAAPNGSPTDMPPPPSVAGSGTAISNGPAKTPTEVEYAGLSTSTSPSSSMRSLTSLSIATQASSPPTSVASGFRNSTGLGPGGNDTDDMTETEDESPRNVTFTVNKNKRKEVTLQQEAKAEEEDAAASAKKMDVDS